MKHAAFHIAFLLLLAFVGPAMAQDYAVRAFVRENTVGMEETASFTIEVKGASFSDVKVPEPPETQGLVLVQRIPSTSRNVSIVNGQMTQSISFTWAYRPLRDGTARIGATEVLIRDQTLRTEAIEVQVVPQSQRPQQRSPRVNPFGFPLPSDEPEEAAPIDDDALFIRAIPSARRAFQNEQVTIEYQLFFRDGVQLRHSRLAGSWDAEGFWREEFDVETRPTPRPTIHNGMRYNTITLKRVAVFPTRTGTMRIDPLRIESEAYVPSRTSDPFDQLFSLRNRFETIELASPPVTIEARPLPAGAPASFTGAVGRFRLDTHVDRTDVEVGEPIEVEVRITGTGNIATMEAPAFSAPGIFEQYDPQVDKTISRTGTRISGEKVFTYVLVPRSNGTFRLPEIPFTYFDPEAARYRTISSEPIPIRVTGTATLPLAVGTTANGLPVDDIAGLLTAGASWTTLGGTPLYQRWGPYAALTLPLLLLAGVYAYRQRVRRLATDAEYARGRIAHPAARRHLKQAQALLDEDRPQAFYEEVARAVLGFVGNRLNVAEKGLTRHDLDEHLAEARVDEEARADLLDLLDECDRARYAPVRPDQRTMEQACNRAARLIAVIDEAATLRDKPSA